MTNHEIATARAIADRLRKEREYREDRPRCLTCCRRAYRCGFCPRCHEIAND